MIRKRRYQFFSLLMAFMVAFTSFGYAVDLHYCQDQLKGFSLLGKAKNCHDKMAKCPNHSISLQKSDSNDCCSNKTVQVDNLDEDGLPILNIDNSSNEVAIEAISLDLTHQLSKAPKREKLILRPPPLLKQDLYLLLETFLL